MKLPILPLSLICALVFSCAQPGVASQAATATYPATMAAMQDSSQKWNFEIQPTVVHTKFHLKNGTSGRGGSDIFPEDSNTLDYRPGVSLLASRQYGDSLLLRSRLFMTTGSGSSTLSAAQPWWWEGEDISRISSDVVFSNFEVGLEHNWRFNDSLELSLGGNLDWRVFDGNFSSDKGSSRLRFSGVGLTPTVAASWRLDQRRKMMFRYSGFAMDSSILGTDVNRQYTGEMSFNWDYKASSLLISVMLDHYHLEEGPSQAPEDFTHVRLRSLFFGIALPF
jgi:hypothetical protein